MIKGRCFEGVHFEQQEVEGSSSRVPLHRLSLLLARSRESRFVDCSFYDRERELGCLFQGCDLREASFLRCDLTLADFGRSQCLGLEMRDCQAMGINFAHASFANRITAKKLLLRSPPHRQQLQLRQLRKLPAGAVRACRQPLAGANLLGASLAGSDLSGSEFGQTDWTSFNLQGCDLRQCDLPGLDLRRVNLAGVQINEDQQRGLLEQIGLVVFPERGGKR